MTKKLTIEEAESVAICIITSQALIEMFDKIKSTSVYVHEVKNSLNHVQKLLEKKIVGVLFKDNHEEEGNSSTQIIYGAEEFTKMAEASMKISNFHINVRKHFSEGLDDLIQSIYQLKENE